MTIFNSYVKLPEGTPFSDYTLLDWHGHPSNFVFFFPGYSTIPSSMSLSHGHDLDDAFGSTSSLIWKPQRQQNSHEPPSMLVWNMNGLWLSIYWEFHHPRPNWRTPSFFRGVGRKTTKQISIDRTLSWAQELSPSAGGSVRVTGEVKNTLARRRGDGLGLDWCGSSSKGLTRMITRCIPWSFVYVLEW